MSVYHLLVPAKHLISLSHVRFRSLRDRSRGHLTRADVFFGWDSIFDGWLIIVWVWKFVLLLGNSYNSFDIVSPLLLILSIIFHSIPWIYLLATHCIITHIALVSKSMILIRNIVIVLTLLKQLSAQLFCHSVMFYQVLALALATFPLPRTWILIVKRGILIHWPILCLVEFSWTPLLWSCSWIHSSLVI